VVDLGVAVVLIYQEAGKPLPLLPFIVLAPIFARPKSEKCLK